MSKLTVIILNYNTKELTRRAIQSCLDLSFKDVEVFVVDNASTDGSVEALTEIENKEKRVRLFLLNENIGFAGGNNVALKEVTSEYVMLLNSDAYFEKDSDVEQILDFMDQHSDIGMITPFVRLPNGSIDPASHRGFPTPWSALSYFTGLEKISANIPILNRIFGGYHQTWKNLHEIHNVDACTGAAMFVRKTALDEVGLLDEQFFMYGEDLDFCFRFKELEWKIVFFPQLTVIHDKHSSGLKKGSKVQGSGESEHTQIRSKTKNAFYDAMVLFYRKHDLGPPWMENLVLFGVRIVQKLKS